MLVVIPQPPGCPHAVTGGVEAGGQRRGVPGDQVVHPGAARGWLSEQVMLMQSLQALPGSGQPGAVKSCGGVSINVGSGVQGEPAEQPLLFCCQVLAGQVERGRGR